MFELLLEKAEGVWVNKKMRLLSWFIKIKENLPINCKWNVFVGKGNWGMACNSIHYIDLITWWTGSNLQTLDSTGLKYWKPSKRNGFWEVYGILKVSFSGGTVLTLESEITPGPYLTRLENYQGEWILEESKGSFTGPNDLSISGQIELQSELTGKLVENILQNGKCTLPTLIESSNMHRIYIQSLLRHWNSSNKSIETILPIT